MGRLLLVAVEAVAFAAALAVIYGWLLIDARRGHEGGRLTMNPKNFPQRKNQRRADVFARMTLRDRFGQPRTDIPEVRESLRDVRSKKRGSRPAAGFTRPAAD